MGTADAASMPPPLAQPSEGGEGGGGGGSSSSIAAPWAAASASRAMNPYLKKAEPTYREYTEVIEPRRIAQGLMSICVS